MSLKRLLKVKVSPDCVYCHTSASEPTGNNISWLILTEELLLLVVWPRGKRLGRFVVSQNKNKAALMCDERTTMKPIRKLHVQT